MSNQCPDSGVLYLVNGNEIRSRCTKSAKEVSVIKWFFCRLFVALILNSGISTGFCQNNPYNEVSIVSPNAAALGKFGDIPVNNHTGIPQISLPIYTIKEGPLSLPISLNYHAGGIKVLETASWVGMGWALNAGGVISRSVNGAPDERLTSSVPDQYYGYLSDSGYQNYYWWPYNYDTYPSQSKPTDPTFKYINDWKSFRDGKFDGEPDLFSFNVGGYTGKFYINDDGAPVVIPDQDIKISFNYSRTSSQSISSFTISVPDGTKFYFGKTDSVGDIDPIEVTNPLSPTGGFSNGQVISSWYLNRISSADGIFNIYLEYAQENYSFYTLSTFPINSTSNSPEYSLIKNMVNGVRLEKIQFSNDGRIEFKANTLRTDLNGNTVSFVDDANSQAKRLDSIRLVDNQNVYKTFVFSYSYFEDNSTPLPGSLYNWGIPSTDKRRLKLLSVQERSGDGLITLPAHNFEYFTEFVPRRICFGQDHWGFYNGVTTNTGLIPTYIENTYTTINGANRESSWPAMRAGTIKKIQYPTGGSSEFDFEPNTTWVSFPTSKWTTVLTARAGFSGTSFWSEYPQDFNGTTYKMNFSNSLAGSQALLSIFRISDNYEMGGWVLEPGQSVSSNLTYPAGQYLVKIKKLAAVSGDGATAEFSAWTTQQVQRNETVGGLRLKSLTDFDGFSTTNNKVTNYDYDSSGKSMGTLFSRPAYVQIIRNDIVRDVGLGNTMNQCGDVFNSGCMPCNGVATYIKSPSSVRPMETTQGNHIGYRQVKVSQSGNGFSIYKYYGNASANVNYGDVAIRAVTTTSCDPNAPNYPHAPLPHDFTRGELKSIDVYNASGEILKQTIFDISYNEGFLKIPGFIVVPDITAEPPPNTLAWNPMVATFYEIKTAKKTREYKLDYEYFYGESGGYTSREQITEYKSNNHSQATSVTEVLNFSDTSIARYKYAMDYKPASCADISVCDQSYNTATINALIAYNSAKTTCADYNCRYWAWQYYIKALTDARDAYVSCRQSTQVNYKSCLATAIATAGNELRAIYDLGSNGRNPVIESTVWKAGKLLNASFTNYAYSLVPSSGLYPGTISTISLNGPSSTFSESYISGSSLMKDPRFKVETSLKYYNGNLVEVSPRSGVKTSYIWGYQNVLPIVKAVGVDFQILNSAYTNILGNLNLIRAQATLKTASLYTYEYSPLVGIKAEFDPNGRKISYEYDKLQRLSIIRDHNNNILKRYCYGYLSGTGDCSLY